MEEKEYLTEESYKKANNKVKWAGRIIILIGIAMVLIGIFVVKVPDMGEDGWFEAKKTRSFLVYPGSFVIMVGFMVRFIVANQRNITAYQMQQIRPVAEEGIEKMAPSVGVAAKEIAKGVKEGLEEESLIYCRHCGAKILSDSTFCEKCGQQIR